MAKADIQIVLSAYNGAQYIREQIDSILAQSASNWELLVRDDNSTDETVSIIEEYVRAYPEKIQLTTDGIGGNASASFMSMLDSTTAPYVMFCDQDDVWLPNKVSQAYDEINVLKKEHPAALFFSDMKVVDETLQEIHASFFTHQKINPAWSKTPYFAFSQSIAAGCTMIFTRELIESLHPIKAPLFQHDHWLALHASYLGTIGYSADKTVLYRQHGQNIVGSHDVNSSYFISKITALGKIYARWRYIKKQFGSEISIWKLMKAKWELNSKRI